VAEELIWLRAEGSARGRPAERSRLEITSAAVALADHAGLTAVTMRAVAAELGTGAGTLYRYVRTREDLLDLMIDAAAAEYRLDPPSGDWRADLLAFGRAQRTIMRRHGWLPELLGIRPTLGPNGVAVLDHVLTVLVDHPARAERKLDAFGLINNVIAGYVRAELRPAGHAAAQRAYLISVVGDHPQLAATLAAVRPSDDQDRRFEELLGRVLDGLLPDA
jgi:AcrR family transcriptional regulator